MARVAEDKVRQLVETSPLRPENVLRNSDPALIGMMVERLSRKLHERTNQLEQLQSTVEPLEQRAASLTNKLQQTALEQKEEQVAAKQIEITLLNELKESEDKLASQIRMHEKTMRERLVAEDRSEQHLRQELKESVQQADAQYQMQEEAQHVAAEKMERELRKEASLKLAMIVISKIYIIRPNSHLHRTKQLQRRAAAERVDLELRQELLAANRHAVAQYPCRIFVHIKIHMKTHTDTRA